MASFLQRLLGVTEPEPEAKAITGRGAAVWETGIPLTELHRTPQKLMAQAQGLFHTNPWVMAAERVISLKFGSVGWHLETPDGDTIEPTQTAAAEVTQLLEKPSPRRTRRDLWSLTGRHLGLCGNAFWYLDERDLLTGKPARIFYINPARMWPAQDRAGNLTGWIMDYEGQEGTGVPFTLDELLHFTLFPPDQGHFGIGLVEAAMLKLTLSDVADRHAAHTFASGGRIPGIVTPKEGVLSDDQFAATARAFRSITEMPDASKRTLVVNGALDFTSTAANPSELKLEEFVKLSGMQILALWGVPESQVGISTTKGMNSGETQKYEEASLWQNAIEPRLHAFRETLQYYLLDKWSTVGFDAQMVFEVPEFDDKTPLFDMAAKAAYVPMTNDQRLDLVGLPPMEDQEVGKQVWLISQLKPLQALGGVDDIILPGVKQLPPGGTADTSAVAQVGKALPLRDRLDMKWVPALTQAIDGVLDKMRTDIAARVKDRYQHLLSQPRDTSVWWNEQRWQSAMYDALQPVVNDIGVNVLSAAGSRLGARQAKADSFIERILNDLLASAVVKVRNINDTTRDQLRVLIGEGLQAGLGPDELGDAISSGVLKNGQLVFGRVRAELIARTEAANLYNESAIRSYGEFGLEQVEVIDGDLDEGCAAANGSVWTLEEALNRTTEHPNCTRDFIPLVA